VPYDLSELRVFREAAQTLLRAQTAGQVSWQNDLLSGTRFLGYLVETHALVLHGSQDPGLAVLEPRGSYSIGGVRSPLLFATRSLPYAVALVVKKMFGDRAMYDFDYSLRVCGRMHRWQWVSFSRSIVAQIDNTDVSIYICPAEAFSRLPRASGPRAEKLTLGLVKGCEEFYSQDRVFPLGRVSIKVSALHYARRLHDPEHGKGRALLRNVFAADRAGAQVTSLADSLKSQNDGFI